MIKNDTFPPQTQVEKDLQKKFLAKLPLIIGGEIAGRFGLILRNDSVEEEEEIGEGDRNNKSGNR